MRDELLRQAKPAARALLGFAVLFGVLAAGATIAQVLLLGEVVDRVFLGGAGLGRVGGRSCCFWAPWRCVRSLCGSVR